MSNVVRVNFRPTTPRAQITAQFIARAEQSAREKYPDRDDLRLAALVGKFEGALIMVMHAVPGAADFVAKIEGINVE